MFDGTKTSAGALGVLAALYVQVAVAEPANPAAGPTAVEPTATAEPVQPATPAGPPPAPAPVAPTVPATPAPAPVAPPVATAPPPAPVAPYAPVGPANPTEAWVHLWANYSGAWLEGRNRIDDEGWRRLCPAPCDRPVLVDGLDVRVTAPSMTPSNTFIIEPGEGTARLRVSGGSATARTLGLIGLAGGLPITFAGVTLLGVGSVHSEPDERTAGIVTLSIGAAAVLAALPLLIAGSTSVKNVEGRHVAVRRGNVTSF
jgi:hypothetical protein